MANGFPKLETVKIFLRPLPEKRPLRTRFDSQHVKASQILSNSPRERFFSCFFIILWEVDSQNLSPRVRQNVRGVS